ncbi:glutamyl-tRNA ligase [Halococcus morrhuae DSM 1307]|uniref:Glutamate--tRNA ligase n=1 Tax=Halococcus morrhuae DSM 1307 TaxID=931277 RepID=M0M8Q3_HALMO|nr:glutamate--tRNA ligase [Halococcus morrhuae]EMA42187.1 glutamyl-tRNA ligase [Halococcus morrhuae DSM 1307]
MDDDLRERVEHEAERHALLNAVKHGEEADVGAVIGPLMGENPEFQEHGDEVPGVVAPVVSRVNELDEEGRQKRLEALAPDLLADLEADDEGDDHPLPDLPNAEEGAVRMRLAPNPNGPWHLGSARMPAVIGTYKDRYDGWMLCRFDDTDPETKRPDLAAYDAILDAIDYLGFEPDEVARASDRMETYYEHARELIDLGGAYTCSCPAAEFSELKNSGEACPHREKAPETTREEFDAMVAGEYDAGEMVLRVCTNIEHKNPALRDWVAFRMIDTPHPREAASEHRCWPLLDFQSGIDDHLFGVTHIIRGIDLQDSAKRQRFLYDYFGWEYPDVTHWGHVQIDAYDVKMSTSTIKGLVEAGDLDGWDDPRAPTVASLRRRGIRGDAITEAMVSLGTSTSNVDLAMSAIYAANRERIDEETDRAFLVRDGVEKTVVGGPETGEPPVHPNHEDRGVREIPVEGAVLIEPDDVPANGERVWLKGYGCVRHTRDAFEFVGTDIDVVREEDVPVVHWVPADDNRTVLLRTMEGDVEGRAEPGIASRDPDEMVQFERIGFARIDAQNEGETVAYYAHS